MSLDYKLKDEMPILEANKGKFVQVATNSNDKNSLVIKIFKAQIGPNIFEVGFSRKKEGIYVGISSGSHAKVYINGLRMSGVTRIENQQVLQALKTLPDYVKNMIQDLNE